MVELLGSLLAGYAQVSFWWLSFFVNRLPVQGPASEKFGNPRLYTKESRIAPLSLRRRMTSLISCVAFLDFDATLFLTPQRALSLSFQDCGPTVPKPGAYYMCDAVPVLRISVATSPSCARDGTVVSAE